MDFVDYNVYSSDLPEPAAPMVLSNEVEVKEAAIEVPQNGNKYNKLASLLLSSGLGDGAGGHQTHHLAENQLNVKLNQILNNYQDVDPTLKDALHFLQSNAINYKDLIDSNYLSKLNRLNFTSIIENNLLKNYSSNLKQFSPLIKKIIKIEDCLKNLNDLNAKLQLSPNDNNALIARIQLLVREKNLIVLKKQLLQNFKHFFTISQMNQHYLQNEDISLEFFENLSLVKQKLKNCSILLSLNNQNLGLKIIKNQTRLINSSQERVLFYLNNQFINNPDATSNSGNELINLSIEELSTNIELFNKFKIQLVQSRSKLILNDFLNQLNNSNLTLSIHDPIRYIGDILAYIYSLIINEVEFLNNFKKFEMLNEILNEILISLSKPIKVSIESIIRNQSDLVIQFKVYQLLKLYILLFKKIIKDEKNLILSTVNQLLTISNDCFFNIINSKVKEIENEEKSEKDNEEDRLLLLPPDWLNDYLLVFTEFFREISIENLNTEFSSEQVDNLFSLVIDKPIEFIDHETKRNFKKEKLNGLIFKLNCFDEIKTKLSIYLSTTKYSETINSKIDDEIINEIIDLQLKFILNETNLLLNYELVNLVFPINQIKFIEDFEIYTSSVQENKIFNLSNLKKLAKHFNEAIPALTMKMELNLEKISSPIYINKIQFYATEKFLRIFLILNKIIELIYPNEAFFNWNFNQILNILNLNFDNNEILNNLSDIIQIVSSRMDQEEEEEDTA